MKNRKKEEHSTKESTPAETRIGEEKRYTGTPGTPKVPDDLEIKQEEKKRTQYHD